MKTISLEVSEKIKEKINASGEAKKGTPDQSNYFTVLFYLLLEAMQTREHSVVTQSKELTCNAAVQKSLNQQNGEIKFSILPANAKTATIDRVQDINEERAAWRGDIQNELITSRQNAQVMMTQASTNVDFLEQDASENSGWLKMLYTIFQVIDGMTQNVR